MLDKQVLNNSNETAQLKLGGFFLSYQFIFSSHHQLIKIHLKPFKAVRPPREKAHLVASRSYVTYTPGALTRKLSENPYSFIHIINPEFSTGEKTKKNSSERFKKVRQRYRDFLNEGFIESDSKPGFYLYNQSTPKGSFTGIIGGVSTLDYLSGKIKKHEQTLTKREEMFLRISGNMWL